MLVDTHCHLHFDTFDHDRELVIKNALSHGVTRLVNVGTDFDTNQKSLDLANQYSFIKHTAGLHPHSAHLEQDRLSEMETFIDRSKPCAVGEIGLDYFKSEAEPQTQKKVFRRMLELADQFYLPVIVHSRNAFADTYQILKDYSQNSRRLTANLPVGVMHCFSYDETEMRKLMDIGFFVSFTGNITYKNASVLYEVACKAPLGRFMLETDAPYLAPQQVRGKRNEPAFLSHTLKFLAQGRAEDPEKIAIATSQAAGLFFGF